MSICSLKINNTEYSQWQEIQIVKSMQSASGGFTLTTFNFFPGELQKWDMNIGDECKVLIDSQPVITGYVDGINPSYGPSGRTVTISGRDKVADLIDCDHDQTVNEWKKTSVTNILRSVCSPFGITVSIDSRVTGDANKKIDSFKANEGEKAIDIIHRACAAFDLLVISTGDGKLTVTKAAANDFVRDSIQTNANIITGEYSGNNRDRYSRYKVKGIGVGEDTKQIRDYTQIVGVVSDSVVSRFRPKVLFSEINGDNGKAYDRAAWEKQLSAGLSRAIIYTTPGWTQTNGKIWAINKLVRIKDDTFGIDNNMLIDSVVFNFKKDEGEYTVLKVVDKKTYTKELSEIKLLFD